MILYDMDDCVLCYWVLVFVCGFVIFEVVVVGLLFLIVVDLVMWFDVLCNLIVWLLRMLVWYVFLVVDLYGCYWLGLVVVWVVVVYFGVWLEVVYV